MTVSNTITKLQYSGDGANRQFGITFPLLSAAHLRIIVTDKDGVEKEITRDYEVSPQLNSLTYPTVQSGLEPILATDKITLIRRTPITQDIDLQTGGVLDAQTLEGGYDKAAMIMQELEEKLERAVKFPAGGDGSGDTSADGFLEEIKQQVSLAQAGATQAQEGAVSAQSSAQGARQAALDAQESFLKAQAAQDGAAQSAVSAQGSADKSQQILQEMLKNQHKEMLFVAGTPSGSYDGSLRQIDLGEDLSKASINVYYNGVRKERPKEWEVNGSKIVFTFDLVSGATVLVETGVMSRTAGQGDIDAALLTHNEDNDAHPVLQARVSALESGAGTGGGEKSLTVTGGVWQKADLQAGKSGSLRFNLGSAAAKITHAELFLGLANAAGGPRLKFPCVVGWGNREGNFATLYWEVRAGEFSSFWEWYDNTSQVNYEFVVYFK